ncbi:MAG: hypothetical protein HYV16_08440 [Gammaproteobacteria bacterium]|nr:hypothetical protein [Gammaproteobacteria bacterium]
MRLPSTNQWITAAVSAIFLWAVSRALATEGLLEAHRELFEAARWLVIGGAALLCLMPRR